MADGDRKIGQIVTLPYELNGHPAGTKFRVIAELARDGKSRTRLELVREEWKNQPSAA